MPGSVTRGSQNAGPRDWKDSWTWTQEAAFQSDSPCDLELTPPPSHQPWSEGLYLPWLAEERTWGRNLPSPGLLRWEWRPGGVGAGLLSSLSVSGVGRRTWPHAHATQMRKPKSTAGRRGCSHGHGAVAAGPELGPRAADGPRGQRAHFRGTLFPNHISPRHQCVRQVGAIWLKWGEGTEPPKLQ